MAGSRIYGLRLDDEMRARWEEAAAACGVKLAEFIKTCVEDRLAGPEAIRAALAALPPESGGLCSPVSDHKPSERALPSSGKKTYAADPKGGKAKK